MAMLLIFTRRGGFNFLNVNLESTNNHLSLQHRIGKTMSCKKKTEFEHNTSGRSTGAYNGKITHWVNNVQKILLKTIGKNNVKWCT